MQSLSLPLGTTFPEGAGAMHLFFSSVAISASAGTCNRLWSAWKAAVWIACVLLGTVPGLAQAASVRVYDSEGRASKLSPAAIREIFFMRQRAWPDGTPIQVFVLPDDDPIHRRFAKEVLGVYPFQLRAAWDRLIYSGTGQAPIQVPSLREMAERLAHTPGAIGYVLEERKSRAD